MPRDRSRKLKSEIVSNGMFASASRKEISATKLRRKVEDDKWQGLGWTYFDTVPEYHYIVTWLANMVAKAVLQVKKDGKVVTDGPAAEALAGLFGGPEGQKEMLRLFSTHLTVTGDCWLIGESGETDEDEDEWEIVSNTRLKTTATAEGSWYRVEDEERDVATDALVMRLWRKHPLNAKKGDSATRAVMPILAELMGLTMRIAADIDSRLTGNGILFVPNEITFPTMQTIHRTAEGEDTEVEARTGADGFMDMLIEIASIAISDQSAASAKVPVVVQVPGEQIANIRHVTFWSKFDEETKGLREEAIRRLSLGMDTPPEVLTGTADMNHWSAWQMEEAAIKAHSEPLLELITASLDEGYLWPYLEDEGMGPEEAREYSFDADTAEMRLRPNRSKEALELYDRAELKGEVLRRENGFTELDQMDEAERKQWFLKKVASGSTTPELVSAALKILGLDFPEAITIEETPTEERPTPSLEEHPDRTPPPEPDLGEIGRAAAAEVMLFRALERAGNKLKSRGIRPDGVAAADLYQYTSLTQEDLDDLLADAWSCSERFAYAVPIDRLESYARTLMLSRKPHDLNLLRSYLNLTQDAA